MLNARTLISLSKYVENILLRSSQVDQYGYMTMDDLIEEINEHPLWEHIQPLDIKDLVNGSPVRRLELTGNKIRLARALNRVTDPFRTRVIPPKKLYYGTGIIGISRVKTFGIKPIRDEFVKLYSDKKMVQVLVHKNTHIAYVEIDAMQAHSEGIEFLRGDLNTYLARHIPAKYIRNIS